MSLAKPIGVVTLPRNARHGVDLLLWCQDVNKALQQLRDRPVPVRNGGRGSDTIPPFWPTLKSSGGESPTYKVSLTDGWLNERIPGVYDGDPPPTATAFHKPHNILWGADGASQSPVRLATDRREFPIAIGEQLSIVVYVDPDGAIGGDAAPADGPLEIAVEEEDEPSVHYVPPRATDEYEGAAGVYHYKMAVLRAADATHTGPWLELFMAGSHLDHFRDLPLLENSAAEAENTGRVFKKYDETTNQYLFRTLDATTGELTITEQESGVEIRGNSVDGTLTIANETTSPDILSWVDGLITSAGAFEIMGGGNLNLGVNQLAFDADGHVYGSDSIATTLYFRGGRFIGTTDPADAPAGLVSQTITHMISAA